VVLQVSLCYKFWEMLGVVTTDMWSLALREDHKLRMFENSVLGKIPGPRGMA
jgi:hypothetical protein